MRPSLDTLFLGLIQPHERFAVHIVWLRPLQGDVDFDFDAFALLFVAFSAALSAASDFWAVVFGAGFAVSAFWASAGGGAATDAKERTKARTRVDKSFMDLNLR